MIATRGNGRDMDVVRDRASVEARRYASAMLNILDDAAEEKTQLARTQRAVLNILDDFSAEKARLDSAQRAVLNILEDASDEKVHLGETQRAILNILDDAASEKSRLEATQKAVLNILDDFDLEKKKVEEVNIELRNEIIERTRVEEALRHAKAAAETASRELEAFSYSVAHDLRAPLRSIDGFSEALLEDYHDRLDTDGKRYLKHVREAAQQMGQLIDDLLNLSRVTRADLTRECVDLSDLARTVFARLEDTQPDRDVEFVLAAHLVAQADRRLLEIVLTNLIGNAWKFTSKRVSARIEFAARTGEQPLVFFVRDNGAGFAQAHTAKLFGVFQRLHAACEFEGTGIGLAIVQRIVHRHAGRIWAEGEIDQGATFYFTLEEERR